MKITAAIALILVAVHGSVAADHAPEWLQSSRTSAPRVLKLRVGEVSLRKAIARLGEPSSRRDVEGFPGEAEYVWKSDGLRITATTMYPPPRRSKDTEIIYAIEVTAEGATRRVLTEHGLQFGSDLASLVQTYGWRYLTGWRRARPTESAVVTFIFQDESELSASFSDAGTLVRLYVRASNE